MKQGNNTWQKNSKQRGRISTFLYIMRILYLYHLINGSMHYNFTRSSSQDDDLNNALALDFLPGTFQSQVDLSNNQAHLRHIHE